MRKNKHLFVALLPFFLILSLACTCPLTGLFSQPATEVPVLADELANPTVEPTKEQPEDTPIPAKPTIAPEVEIVQWAEAADASSQFSDVDYSIGQALGEPDAFDCNDNPNAWGPDFNSSTAWIEFYFVKPVFATGITLYESYSSDAISAVMLIDIEGNSVPVYQGTPSMPDSCPFTIEIEVSAQPVPVHGLRVELDMNAMQAWWAQIDAVELRGIPVSEDSPYGQVQPLMPTANPEEFTFNNRWNHYLPLYELMDPRYDIGESYSVQWETVNKTGTMNDAEGSTLVEEPLILEHILHVISLDIDKEFMLFLPRELTAGKYNLQTYDASAETNNFSATLWVKDELYTAQEGIIEIFESDEGVLTAKLLIFLVSSQDSTRDAVVMAFFNNQPLQ